MTKVRKLSVQGASKSLFDGLFSGRFDSGRFVSSTKLNRAPYQHGLGLISALFFITVAAMLTVAIARSVATSAQAASLDIQSTQAFLAAESGAQLGMNELYSPLGGGTCTNRTVALDTVGLTDCDAAISCTIDQVSGDDYVTIDSVGSCRVGGAISAQRRIVVRTRP